MGKPLVCLPKNLGIASPELTNCCVKIEFLKNKFGLGFLLLCFRVDPCLGKESGPISGNKTFNVPAKMQHSCVLTGRDPV